MARRDQMPSDRGRLLRWGLASAVLHATLLLLPLWEPSAEPADLEVTYVPTSTTTLGAAARPADELPLLDRADAPRTVLARAEAGRAVPAPGVEPQPRKRVRRRTPPPEERLEPTPATSELARPAPPEAATVTAPTADADADADADAALAEVDLFPEALFAELAGGGEPAEPRDERARIASRIHTYVRDLQAEDRVAQGLIDPYFIRLKEGLVAGFDPSWSHLDEEAGEDGAAGTLKAWAEDYLATAGRYGENGTPYHAGEQDQRMARMRGTSPPAAGLTGTGDGQMQLQMFRESMDLWRDMVQGRAGGVELLALIRVTQASDGRLIDVEVTAGSGQPMYDRLAKDTVRKTLKEPMVPERAGSGLGLTGEHIISLWSFRTRFVVVPPAWSTGPGLSVLGMAGCDLEADGKPADCYRPLERLVHPHLELVAVY